jgi:hypothetical protein
MRSPFGSAFERAPALLGDAQTNDAATRSRFEIASRARRRVILGAPMSDELAKRVGRLARLVAQARELSEIDTYFHDALALYPPFLAESVEAVHKPLREIVRGVAQSYGCALQGDGKLHRIERLSLWHGSLGSVVGAMAIIIYFDDQQRGVASFGRISDPNTHHVRFSLPEEARDPNLELRDMQVVGAGPARRRGLA